MNGQRLAATPADVMIGYQRIEKGKPPTYVIGRIADGYTPPPRETLGDTNEDFWPNSKDPWASASWLPFWNPETREVLIFHATSDGSKDAVVDLTQAYVLNCELHTDQINYDPLIELSVDSYESKHGRRIYFPVFETLDWVERPTAVRRIIPPPVKMLQLTAVPTVVPATPPSDTIPAKSDQSASAVAKSKSKKPVNFDDMDIPF
jgi:hypothetical protein